MVKFFSDIRYKVTNEQDPEAKKIAPDLERKYDDEKEKHGAVIRGLEEGIGDCENKLSH